MGLEFLRIVGLLAGAFAQGLAAQGAERVLPIRGCDASEIPEVEAAGGRFFDGGVQGDALAIMHRHGMNLVRLRVWVDPTRDGVGARAPQGFCGKEQTLKMAKRVVEAGMRVAIDFHYSDWWADPQKQPTPKAWEKLNHPALTKRVYEYTKDVVAALIAQGTTPSIVQPGNEVRNGVLWPDGRLTSRTPDEWARLADLLKAGLNGIRDGGGNRNIRTMIHLDLGGDNKQAREFMDEFARHGVRFDILGLSYYPWWHGSLAAMKANLDDLAARYHKDLMIAETAYPWTLDFRSHDWPHLYGDQKAPVAEFPATPEGQRAYLDLLVRDLLSVPDNQGVGLLWWAPAWISTKTVHNGWDNLTLFDYDGNALPGLDAFAAK